MAYPYYNQFYQNQYMPQNTQQNTGITWVQGENSAKSYPVAAGQSVLLMDSENPVMYIKSTDQSGVPMPLRIFDYKERSQMRSNTQEERKIDYISRDEFNAFKDEIKAELRQSKSTTNFKKQQTKEE